MCFIANCVWEFRVHFRIYIWRHMRRCEYCGSDPFNHVFAELGGWLLCKPMLPDYVLSHFFLFHFFTFEPRFLSISFTHLPLFPFLLSPLCRRHSGIFNLIHFCFYSSPPYLSLSVSFLIPNVAPLLSYWTMSFFLPSFFFFVVFPVRCLFWFLSGRRWRKDQNCFVRRKGENEILTAYI